MAGMLMNNRPATVSQTASYASLQRVGAAGGERKKMQGCFFEKNLGLVASLSHIEF